MNLSLDDFNALSAEMSARAAAPNVYQVLQPAQNNINMNNTTFTGPMYEVKDNEKVNLGGKTNG